MRKSSTFFTALGAALVIGGLAAAPALHAGGVKAGMGTGGEMPNKKVCAKATDPIVVGGCIATNRKKGNCMSCHTFKGIEKTRVQAGNIGPPLVGMKQRFPDKKKLRAQVWDATKFNPNTLMPPFGRHQIMTEKEIDLVVEWLYTL